MNIYLIRHGQTDWNILGKIQGRQDTSLNEMGRKQAQLLARGMDSRPVTQIFCSRQKRAAETAAAIGARQKVDVDIVTGLEEVEFGLWEGLTMEEIRGRFPEEYKRWMINPVEVAPPGGETLTEVTARCAGVAEAILAQAKGDIAIVSHGATLAHMISWFLHDHAKETPPPYGQRQSKEMPPPCGQRQSKEEEEIIVDNASITTVHYSALTGNFLLREANDTSHLDVTDYLSLRE